MDDTTKESADPKRRGRPPGSGKGLTESMHLRITPEMVKRIDKLARRDGCPSHAEVRILLEVAISIRGA